MKGVLLTLALTGENTDALLPFRVIAAIGQTEPGGGEISVTPGVEQRRAAISALTL